MSQQSEIMQIEEEIKLHEHLIELGAALERLQQNPDFKKVFDEYLFKELAATYVRAIADADSSKLERYTAQMGAIGQIQVILEGLLGDAERAKEFIKHATELQTRRRAESI